MTDQIAELPTLDRKLRNLRRLIDEHVEQKACLRSAVCHYVRMNRHGLGSAIGWLKG